MNLQIITFLYFLRSVVGYQYIYNGRGDYYQTHNLFQYDIKPVLSDNSIQWQIENTNFDIQENYHKENIETYLEDNDALVGENTKIYFAHCDIFGENIKYSYQPFEGTLKFDGVNKYSPPIYGAGKENFYETNEIESSVAYIETLIAIDFETYKYFHEDVRKLSKYIAALWNGVDLRFREFKNPKIRLNIAGLVVPTKRKCAPYFEQHLLSNKIIKNNDALHALTEYFTTNRYLLYGSNYDIVIGLTRRKFYDPEQENVVGYSFQDFICDNKGRIGGAIVTDNGTFSSLLVIAHEIGHVLGADHDPNPPNKDAPKFMMASSGTGYHWTDNSINVITNFTRYQKCLKNKPYVGRQYKKILPGKVIDREEKCRADWRLPAYTGAQPEYYNCKKLYCRELIGHDVYYQPHGVPLEGTTCGHAKVCIRGECVDDPDPRAKNIPPPPVLTMFEQCKNFGYDPYKGNNRLHLTNCRNLTCSDKELTWIMQEPPQEGSKCGFGGICQNQKCVINPEILKGKKEPPAIKSREFLCHNYNPKYHEYQDSRDRYSCSKYQCTIDGKTIYTPNEKPADGTECGRGNICFDGFCQRYSDVFGSRIKS